MNFDRDVDSFFDTLLGGTVAPRIRRVPALDMHESQDESVLAMDLPGIAREDIKISVDRGVLTISGERKVPGLPEGSRPLHNEITYGTFVRTLELPHPVSVEAISAELNNGILRVVLPKADEAKRKEIEVKVR
jgi:HSP20 family protein